MSKRDVQRARVVVDGHGPVVDEIAGSLRRSGVGSVKAGRYAADTAELLGLSSARRGTAASEAVVLVRSGPPPAMASAPWFRAGAILLPVECSADYAEVGPLVIPGSSSCPLCHELLRADRSGLVALEAAPPPGLGRLDHVETPVSLAILVGAVVTLMLGDAIGGRTRLGGVSTGVDPVGPQLTHRHWPRHAACRWCDLATGRQVTMAV